MSVAPPEDGYMDRCPGTLRRRPTISTEVNGNVGVSAGNGGFAGLILCRTYTVQAIHSVRLGRRLNKHLINREYYTNNSYFNFICDNNCFIK